jgi:hypothetical protein
MESVTIERYNMKFKKFKLIPSLRAMESVTIIIYILLFLLSCSTFKTSDYNIKSPDGKIIVNFDLSDNNRPFYCIQYEDHVVMQKSRLGLIREDEDFSENLRIASVSDVQVVKDDYEMLHGKKQSFLYQANRKIFHLINENGKKLDIIFQVSNDGVAFRYFFPDESSDVKKIKQEVTSFKFLPGTKAWVQPMAEAKSGWCQVNPSYEEHYIQNIELEKLPESKAGWVFPALFSYRNLWMLISETAPDRDYCGSRLQYQPTDTSFTIGFPQAQEIFPGGALNPESTVPWYTPWRIIALGDLKTIVESNLGTDLAKPSVIENVDFIKPGRASWSWVLLKDDSIVYDVQKKFIDYAADMGWEYCLIDVNWDTKIGYDKISELAQYASSKNVDLILWYNSSGDWNTTTYHPKSKLVTPDDRINEFTRLKEMGIKGIKVDFFGGDGQSMMAYYQDIFEGAAKFGLLVNCHGSTIPRGWQRTYPNLVSMEAVRGFEFVTFEQSNADLQPTHCCVLPFTRNVFDPMDFTPVCFSEVPNLKRKTSNAFELALSIIFHSGFQHYAEIPEGMAAVPEYVKAILRKATVSWEETVFIDGYPGRFVVIARKSKDTWYVAGINGEEVEKRINLRLPFLRDTKTGILITDGEDSRSFSKQEITLNSEEPFEIRMKGNGGFVIKFKN